MKKKFWICLALALAGCVLAGCGTAAGQSGSDSGGTPSSSLEVPEGDKIIPLPDDVDAPGKPTLPDPDLLAAPYIGAVGSTTDAYNVTEIKEEGKLTGAEVSWPAEGKELSDYHFVWFDVYNYAFDYHNIRFDFEEINGAEKVAVAAMYMEAYDKGYPAVGVLVESLMDGSMSYVTNLTDYKVIDDNYKQESDLISDQTVARLYVYLDSNPAQAPSDRAGSLKITGITFLKDGDPLTEVDNSPKSGEVTAEGGYTLAAAENKVFRAEYTTDGLTADSYVGLELSRFSGAYGRISLQYTASNAEKLTVTDGASVLGAYNLSASGKITLDIRGVTKLSQLRFYIDSTSEKTAAARVFELEELTFVYTPYVTDAWSATSKFWLRDQGLGGKIAATYDCNVGWDYLSAKVRYWTTDYKVMLARFKISGQDGVPERFGLSVNSNNVLLEVENSKISDLEYDAATGEYWLVVDLSEVERLSALNFFFDSVGVEAFSGTRTVEFTAIEFFRNIDEVDTGREPQTGAMSDPYDGGYRITAEEDGYYTVSWTADGKQEYGKTAMSVTWYTSDYKYLKIGMETASACTVGVYRSEKWSGLEDALQAHTPVAAGETVWYIELPADTPNFGKLGMSFELRFFFDAAKTDTSGSVKIKAEFVKERPPESFSVGDLTDMNNEGYTITETEADTWRVVWTEERKSVWAKAKLPIRSFDESYKYLRLTFTSDKASKVGVYSVDEEAWKAHTALIAGRDEWIIAVPEGTTGSFDLIFYFDGGVSSSGDVTMKAEFLKEEPFSIGALKPSQGFTVSRTENGYHVTWVAAPKSDYVGLDVTGRKAENAYFNFTVKNNADTAMKFGLYADGYSNALLSQRELIADGTYTFSVMMNEKVGETVNLRFFLDYNIERAGDIDITNISFGAEKQEETVTEPFSVGDLTDMNNEGYTITETEADTWRVVWTEERKSVWAKAKLPIRSFDESYKYLRLTFTSDKASKVGVWVNDSPWKEHTALKAGGDEWLIEIPEGTTGSFDIIFFFDGGVKSSGDVTMKAEFLEMSSDPSSYDKIVEDIEDWTLEAIVPQIKFNTEGRGK